MANENKNQDDLNANDVRGGEESGNCGGKAVGNETPGKKLLNELCNFNRHFSIFVVLRFEADDDRSTERESFLF